MSPEREPTQLAASVRARLRNLARARGEEFQRVLSDFLIPVLRATSRGERLGIIWTAGGPWRTET